MNHQEYYKTSESNVNYNNSQEVTDCYNRGFVLTRVSKGNMIQTRSLRIDLSKFELNSENRRILNKNQDLAFRIRPLPLEDYSWEIHAMGKDFYTKRFGDGTMSASKIKEMFQETDKSNMNSAFDFKYDGVIVGYCLAYQNDEIIHYAYPFYDLDVPKENSLGIGMMTKAINWAKDNGKKYIYLGSVVEPSSKYKLQFNGAEWFDSESQNWSDDLEKLKELISHETSV